MSRGHLQESDLRKGTVGSLSVSIGNYTWGGGGGSILTAWGGGRSGEVGAGVVVGEAQGFTCGVKQSEDAVC